MQVAVLIKLLGLVVVCAVLGGCAGYDYSFNKAQHLVDYARHVNNRVQQGQLP